MHILQSVFSAAARRRMLGRDGMLNAEPVRQKRIGLNPVGLARQLLYGH